MTEDLYQQLPLSAQYHLRVLTLHHDVFDQPISCDLTVVDLDDKPEYTALSYVWGDMSQLLPIHVNGSSISATESLVAALRHIRKFDSDVTLWIDAICINQSDIEERNSQIQLMNKVYYQANNVLVWLGEADPTTAELARIIEAHEQGSLPLAAEADSNLEFAVHVFRQLTLFEIVALRPWWHRVWTVQESVMPDRDPTFQCGNKIFSWTKFFATFFRAHSSRIRGLNAYRLAFHPDVQDLMKWRSELMGGMTHPQAAQNSTAMMTLFQVRKAFKRNSSISISFCLSICLGRHASVPQDYVYGFLGLLSPEYKSQLVIDYRQSHWDTYRDTFRALLRSGSSGDLIAFARMPFHSEAFDKPSWIPDLSAHRNVAEYTSKFFRMDHTSGPLKPVEWSSDGKILELHRVRLDCIDQVHIVQGTLENWLSSILRFGFEIGSLLKSVEKTDHGPIHDIADMTDHNHISRLLLGSSFFHDTSDIIDSEA